MMNRTMVIRQPLSALETQFPRQFCRIHRSYLVNCRFFLQVERYAVTLINGTVLPVPAKRYMELRVRRKTGWLFSFAYLFLADVGLAVISAAASVGEHRNIAVRDISLAVVLAVYLSCWAAVIRVPAVWKMLVGVIMLHYAAMLNTLSNLFAALILGGRYLTEINADTGSLTFDLCLLAATALTYPLVWGFLRQILRNNLPILGDRQTYRGLGYLCVVFLLFSIVTYLPAYERQPEAAITRAEALAALWRIKLWLGQYPMYSS